MKWILWPVAGPAGYGLCQHNGWGQCQDTYLLLLSNCFSWFWRSGVRRNFRLLGLQASSDVYFLKCFILGMLSQSSKLEKKNNWFDWLLVCAEPRNLNICFTISCCRIFAAKPVFTVIIAKKCKGVNVKEIWCLSQIPTLMADKFRNCAKDKSSQGPFLHNRCCSSLNRYTHTHRNTKLYKPPLPQTQV